MTDKPTPTDAELKAMWQLHAADIGGILDFARAVLAKWGTPAPVGAEPVARLVIGKTKGGVSLTHMVVPAAYQLQEGTYALYTTPQPTQTVPPAGREPLTDAQIAEMMRDTWGCASIAPRHAPEFARAVEAAHGIGETP